ncbi:hypothetical protein [Mangrovitalea sediminis]|uniref:hypothetical protein n=1 Tax=Mangrovitalea sediminis TaxID=1982043 RepID=UPI000BE50BF4|nr:hypothetical protein [Mangrovitalea sediminis]
MDTWFLLPLGDGITAQSVLSRIEPVFAHTYRQYGEPSDMAVFTQFLGGGDLHCSVNAYFSPATAGIATEFKALPCRRPRRESLELVFGGDACWERLFG